MGRRFKSLVILKPSLFLAAILVLTARASESERKEPYQGGSPLQCSGHADAGSAIFSGVMLLIMAGLAPSSHTERESNARTIFGRCEIRDENEAHPIPKPCFNVELTLRQGRQVGRTVWVQGFEFEIAALNEQAVYNVEAFSESYQAGAALEKIQPGKYLRIEIKI